MNPHLLCVTYKQGALVQTARKHLPNNLYSDPDGNRPIVSSHYFIQGNIRQL